MDFAHQPTKVLITGGSGTGKSTYWTRFCLGYAAKTKFVYDHEGELAQRLRIKPARTLPELAWAIHSGWVIFDPHARWAGRLEEGFAFFCDFVFRASQDLPGTKLFACDELQCLVDTHTLSDELRLILQTGRRYGIDFAAISQQPNELHNRIRAQLTEIVSFLQVEPRAIEWLVAAGFTDPALRGLRAGEYIARNLRTRGEMRGSVF